MEVIANVPEVNSEGLNKSEKANNGSYSSQKKNRIQVSNTKKPLFFCVNLAKKYMRLHEEVELSALGMAIATVVTISEILKNNGLAIEKKILTSTVGMKDENKGKLVKKSKIAILLGKSENFESLLTVATDVVAKITEDNKEKVAERKRVLNPKVTRAFNLALQLGKGHYKDGRVLKPHLIVKAVDSDLALIMETSQPFKITRLQSCHWTNFRFLCTSGSLSLLIDSNDQYLIEMNLRNGDVKMLPSLPIVVQSLVGCFSGTLSEIALLGLKNQHLYLFLSSGEEWQVIEVSAMSPKMVRQILEGPVVNKKTLFWISNGNTVERLTENGEYSKREI